MTKKTTENTGPAQAEILTVRTRRVRLDEISIPNDYPRQPDPEWVKVIAQSFVEGGQLQAVRVVEFDDGRLELNFGYARVLAAKSLGWAHVWADVIPANELEDGRKRISTLFENLVRSDFNALQRSLALSELKDIYEQLYPETKRGGDTQAKQDVAGKSAKLAFFWEAAEQTGLSERAIFRAIAIAKGLTEASITRLRGTWVAANQSQLHELAQLTVYQQGAVLDLLLKDPVEVTNVSDALELLRNGRLPKPAEKAYSKAVDSLARMKPELREHVFDAFEAEILAWAAPRLEKAGK